MPYKVVGKNVVKKSTGKVVGHSNNPKQYVKVLNAVAHGWNPTQPQAKCPLHTNPIDIDKAGKNFIGR